MANWIFEQDFHTQGGIAAYEREGIPVLVVKTGTYPTSISDDGRTTATVPHVVISIGGGTKGLETYYNGVTVTVLGTWTNGRRVAFPVFSDVHYDGSRNVPTPDVFIAIGESHLGDALRTVAEIDIRYEAASSRMACLGLYRAPLSRADYEAACLACAVEPLSDTDCDNYGVKFGNFTYPEYAPDYIVQMTLAYWRLQQLKADAKVRYSPRGDQRVATVPAKDGQLWEKCEQCGTVPVYMPLHLCDKCWPKAA